VVELATCAPAIGLRDSALHFFAALRPFPGVRTFYGSRQRRPEHSTEGAGPALAAHSKDASTPGHNPASEATGKPSPLNDGGEVSQRLLQQVEDFMRASRSFQWRCSSQSVSEVRELLTEELKDAYSAEKQALRCMQRALRKASADALRKGIQLHIEQTQVQIERVEQAMEKLGVRPGRKVCEAMRGLVEEAQHQIEEHDEKGPILDLIIVAGMQRIEHYEIAAYGTDVALAKALGEKEVADLLSETLEEEKQTDLKLTEVTQKAIMPQALAGDEEEGERGRGRSGGRRKAA
jgi:ferritin-like metal-binding protein YciE